MKVAWSKYYAHPLPPEHRFPMIKYELLPEQLLYEGTISKNDIFEPVIQDDKTILLTHEKEYFDRLKNLQLSKSEIRKTGFPHTRALVERELIILNGTIQCTHFAFKDGVAFNVAGGTHHAFTDRGEGFCLLNDIAVAANYLLFNRLVSKILIIDLDVHQGNGTAQIFKDNSHVFTFSMHGKKNYPMQKENSDLDVELGDGISDFEYLEVLKNSLNQVLNIFKPDFIFYQSGVDILETDVLGRLNISLKACKERDEVVFKTAQKFNIPTVVVMGGGYSKDIKQIIEAHANTYRAAKELFF